MPVTAAKISARTRAILESAAVDCDRVRLTCGQIDHDAYRDVDAVLSGIGGVWSTTAQAHVFPATADPQALLTAQLGLGTVPLHPRNAEGYVRTPDKLAASLVDSDGYTRDLQHLPKGATVLDPSAGDGSLVRAVLDHNGRVHVHAVEPHPDRVHALRQLAADHPGRVTVHESTFEEFAASWDGPLFDLALMNPPFAVPGNATLWVDHVRAAHALVSPGGQVVAIVPISYSFAGARSIRDLRTWAGRIGGSWEALGRDAFAESGTTVSAGVLVLPVPLPERADGVPWWLWSGDVPAGEPVKVEHLRTTMPLLMPVQSYPDAYPARRVARFIGCCHGCGRTIWVHTDGYGEPATDWSACHIIEAADVGMVGPAVLLCMGCGTSYSDRYDAAHLAGSRYWTPAEPEGPQIYPGDLCAGMHVRAEGLTERGDALTVSGRLTADPEDFEHDNGHRCVILRFERADGGTACLHADPGTRVTELAGPVAESPAPATQGQPDPGAPVRARELAPAAAGSPFVSDWGTSEVDTLF